MGPLKSGTVRPTGTPPGWTRMLGALWAWPPSPAAPRAVLLPGLPARAGFPRLWVPSSFKIGIESATPQACAW